MCGGRCTQWHGALLSSFSRVVLARGRAGHGELKAGRPIGTVAAEAGANRSRLVDPRRFSSSTCRARFHGARWLSAKTLGQRCLAALRRAPVGPIAAVLGRGPAISDCWSFIPRRGFICPDLSDAPPAKIERGPRPSLAHYRRSRPDGTDPDPRRTRPRHHSRALLLSARQRESSIDKPRQGRVPTATETRRCPAEIRHREFCWCAAWTTEVCVNTTLLREGQ